MLEKSRVHTRTHTNTHFLSVFMLNCPSVEWRKRKERNRMESMKCDSWQHSEQTDWTWASELFFRFVASVIQFCLSSMNTFGEIIQMPSRHTKPSARSCKKVMLCISTAFAHKHLHSKRRWVSHTDPSLRLRCLPDESAKAIPKWLHVHSIRRHDYDQSFHQSTSTLRHKKAFWSWNSPHPLFIHNWLTPSTILAKSGFKVLLVLGRGAKTSTNQS